MVTEAKDSVAGKLRHVSFFLKLKVWDEKSVTEF